MIDRFCERIQKNIDEEGGMTPRERVMALLWGKEKDRVVACTQTLTTYITKILDSHAEAVKEHVLKHKHMSRFAPGIIPPYWTPSGYFDAAITAARRYGRYE